MIRLDKYLADAGLGTRSEVKNFIKKKKVTINGETVIDAARKIDTSSDVVCCNQTLVSYQKTVTYLFYKPAGYVTARTDDLHPTVMDFFPPSMGKDLSPVGRLDKDTEGLLLITNDGALNHRLMSPAHHVNKTYFARLDKPFSPDAVTLFKNGVDIGDEKLTRPAILEAKVDEEGNPCAIITLSEGRYHQVKRMMEAIGCKVLYLKRTGLKNLTLGKLTPGQWRELTQEELEDLNRGNT